MNILIAIFLLALPFIIGGWGTNKIKKQYSRDRLGRFSIKEIIWVGHLYE